MTRIGSGGLVGLDRTILNNLAQSFTKLNQAGTRLSTLKRINRAADDPAGLIALESLRAELTALEAADSNAARAASAIRVADSGLSQASSLLNEIRGAVLDSAGNLASPEQVAASQLQIDSALEALNRIGATTRFNGRDLLGGGSGYRTSGVNDQQVTDIQIISRATAGAQSIDLEVIQAATPAELVLSDAPPALVEDTTLAVTGSAGTTALSFAAGTSPEEIAAAINASAETTGVEASVSDGELVLTSSDVGSDASVSVEVVAGSLTVPDVPATGTDVVATIGSSEITGNGNTIEVRTDQLSADVTFSEGFTGEVDTITIEGEALRFVFSSDPSSTATLALPQLHSTALGGATGRLSDLASGGSASLASGNLDKALDILDAASGQLLDARGRLGAFEKFTIESSRAVNQSAQINISEAIRRIGDADVALETAKLVQSQILTEAGISSLGLGNARRGQLASLFDAL